MPQFDISLFASQIFWLAVCMLSLYLFMARVSVPRIYQILATRQEKINSDLHKSDELRLKSLKIQADYEKIIADAKVKSNEMVVVSLNKTAIESAFTHKEINHKMTVRIQAAEDRVAASKIKAKDEMRSIAAAVASAVVQRVVQLDVPDQYLSQALNDFLEEKKAS